jgi:DNA polymerase (family 10)
MKNRLVSELLYKIADIMDIKGEIFFKTRAYRMAAQKIEILDEDIEDVVKEKRLEDIPGIGEAIAKKVTEFIETGKLEYYEKLKKEIPEGLLKMLDIPGMGPKKVAAVYNKLGIKTVEELKKACLNNKVQNLEGFGKITEVNIIRGIQLLQTTSGRVLLNIATINGNNYISYLKRCKEIKEINIAGSLRRTKETIGDIDILVSSDKPDKVMDYFVKYNDILRVIMKGPTKSSVLLNDNLQVDLRVVEEKSYGAALQYFTGSKEHNVKLRSIAIKKGYKLNEYGIFDKETDKFLAGKNEREVYKKLGCAYIEPELRENRGEIDFALKNKLPKLVNISDIRGDLHIHSNYSDGFEKIETMADSAKKKGYEYIGIADHSQSLKVANGLSPERLEKKAKDIKKLNKKFKDLKIFCGTECDIKSDGALDYPNSVLKKLDYVGIGIHTKFKMDEKEATNRILKGMDNEYVTFLAHPTCRMIGHRKAFNLDMEKIFEKALEQNIYLEINSFPDRLDLNDYHTKLAKDRNCKLVINTDSHNLDHLEFMKYGISMGRRGWLEKEDILNTKSLHEIEKIFGL